jgi:hypothetical protein
MNLFDDAAFLGVRGPRMARQLVGAVAGPRRTSPSSGEPAHIELAAEPQSSEELDGFWVALSNPITAARRDFRLTVRA